MIGMSIKLEIYILEILSSIILIVLVSYMFSLYLHLAVVPVIFPGFVGAVLGVECYDGINRSITGVLRKIIFRIRYWLIYLFIDDEV